MKTIVKVVYLKIIFILIILCSLSFTQFRVDYEVSGTFDGNQSTSGGILLGYDFIKWEQKSVNSGIGFNININTLPLGKRLNSIYSIVNYNVEEKWNIFSKIGINHCILDKNSLLSDEFGMLLAIGANYNFNDNFHLELGYHLTMIENYDYERFVLSYIKHFELDK